MKPIVMKTQKFIAPAPAPAPVQIVAGPEESANLLQESESPNILQELVSSTQSTLRKAPPDVLRRYQSKLFNTRQLADAKQWLHVMLYGDTDARKTTTAAHFGDPESVRIIMVRNKEQLKPLQDEGYEFFLAESGADVEDAITYCESFWPDWAMHPDRTLILDDITAFNDFLLEESSTNEDTGREYKDLRKVYGVAKNTLQAAVKSVFKRPMHFIAVATQKIFVNDTEGTERIGPNLPPAINILLQTDFENLWYIDKENNHDLLTSTTTTVFKKRGDDGREKTYRRIIRGKNKQTLKSAKSSVLLQRETADLRKVWTKILTGKIPTATVAPSTKAVVHNAIHTLNKR
jgi:hypothetical protein